MQLAQRHNSTTEPGDKEWINVRLEEIAEIQAGGNAPQGEGFFRSGTLPFVRVQHFNGKSKFVERWDSITEEAVRVCRLHKFPKGSIVVPKSGASINLEKRAVLAQDSYVVSHLAVLRAKPSVCDEDFLYYLLCTLQFASSSGGAALPFLNLSHIAKKEVLLPPLPKQRQIAGALGAIQESVESQRRILAESRILWTATTAKIFEETAAERQVLLGEVIEKDIQNGLYRHSSEYGPDGTPIVRITDFPNEGDVIKAVPNSVRITTPEVEQYRLRPGNILVNRVNSLSHIGKCALVKDTPLPTVFESNMMRLSVKSAVALPEFVWLWLRGPMAREHMRKCAKQAVGQASINQADVRSVPIPLLGLRAQKSIVRTMSAIHESLGQHSNLLDARITLFNAVLHKMVSGALLQ